MTPEELVEWQAALKDPANKEIVDEIYRGIDAWVEAINEFYSLMEKNNEA